MTSIIEIIGRDGRRRRAKKGETLLDGERFSVPMTFQDAQVGAAIAAKFSDGTVRVVDAQGQLAGHRPGFCFDAAADGAAAAKAYEARSRRLDPRRIGDAARIRTLDEREQDSAAAYAERSKRMTEAWRQR